jgi:hypothetical protein
MTQGARIEHHEVVDQAKQRPDDQHDVQAAEHLQHALVGFAQEQDARRLGDGDQHQQDAQRTEKRLLKQA